MDHHHLFFRILRKDLFSFPWFSLISLEFADHGPAAQVAPRAPLAALAPVGVIVRLHSLTSLTSLHSLTSLTSLHSLTSLTSRVCAQGSPCAT